MRAPRFYTLHTTPATRYTGRESFSYRPSVSVLAGTGDAALRTKRWVESGGARAVGEDFLGVSPVPARTETEGRYEKDSRPVYRVAGVVCKSDL